jgi:hypothetical protein
MVGMRAPLPDPASLRSKAFTITGALAFVDATQGPGGRERLLAALDPESRALCTRPLLSSEWVPFRCQVALYVAADKVFGQGDLAVCRKIGRFTSEDEMSRVNRIFLQLGGLETWIRMAGLLWRRYYSEGALGVEPFGDTAGTVLVTGFNPIHEAFCVDFAGWLEKTVELSGFKDAVGGHEACLLDGAPACRYVLRWTR